MKTLKALIASLVVMLFVPAGFAQTAKSDETVVQMKPFEVVESKFRNPLFAYRPIYERDYTKVREEFKVVQAILVVAVYPEGAATGLKPGDIISKVGDFKIDQSIVGDIVANNKALFVPGATVRICTIPNAYAQTETPIHIKVPGTLASTLPVGSAVATLASK